MERVTVASYTVRATMEQATRWNRQSTADGHRAVGTWLAEAVDTYMKVRARAGRPLPLAWHHGVLPLVVLSTGGELRNVRGMISPPFGHFRGSGAGPCRIAGWTLLYLPTGRIIASVRTSKQAKELAAELAPVYVRDEATALGIAERHMREAM